MCLGVHLALTLSNCLIIAFFSADISYNGPGDFYKAPVNLYHNGTIVWFSTVAWQSSCAVDITWFPVDRQVQLGYVYFMFILCLYVCLFPCTFTFVSFIFLVVILNVFLNGCMRFLKPCGSRGWHRTSVFLTRCRIW